MYFDQIYIICNFICVTSAVIYSITNINVGVSNIDQILEDVSIMKCHLSCKESVTCKQAAFEDTTPLLIKCYHISYFMGYVFEGQKTIESKTLRNTASILQYDDIGDEEEVQTAISTPTTIPITTYNQPIYQATTNATTPAPAVITEEESSTIISTISTSTTIPFTTVPSTKTPLTTVPSITTPLTTALSRTASYTTVLLTTVPSTTTPLAIVPLTTAPLATASYTTVPLTTVLSTITPLATVPSTAAPLTTVPLTTIPSTTPKNKTKCSERKCNNREKFQFINNDKCAILYSMAILKEHEGDCDVFYLIDKVLYLEKEGQLFCFDYVSGGSIDIEALKIVTHGNSECGKFEIVRDSTDSNFILEIIWGYGTSYTLCLTFYGDNTKYCDRDPIFYCMGCLNEYA